MFVRACVSGYVHVCVCVCVRACVRACVCMCVCVRARARDRARLSARACVCVCACARACMFVRVKKKERERESSCPYVPVCMCTFVHSDCLSLRSHGDYDAQDVRARRDNQMISIETWAPRPADTPVSANSTHSPPVQSSLSVSV